MDMTCSYTTGKPPSIWGADREFMSSPRLDDLQCAFSSLCGFLESAPEESLPVHVVFDNEEIGSSTRQGAASPFLEDTLRRITEALGLTFGEYLEKLPQSFLLSADNAHGMHPNYADKCDPVNRPRLGGGVVVKYSGNQKYATDAVSAAIVRVLAKKGRGEAPGVYQPLGYSRRDHFGEHLCSACPCQDSGCGNCAAGYALAL